MLALCNRPCCQDKTCRDYRGPAGWLVGYGQHPCIMIPQEQLSPVCFSTRPHHRLLCDKKVVTALDKAILEGSPPFSGILEVSRNAWWMEPEGGGHSLQPVSAPTSVPMVCFLHNSRLFSSGFESAGYCSPEPLLCRQPPCPTRTVLKVCTRASQR